MLQHVEQGKLNKCILKANAGKKLNGRPDFRLGEYIYFAARLAGDSNICRKPISLKLYFPRPQFLPDINKNCSRMKTRFLEFSKSILITKTGSVTPNFRRGITMNFSTSVDVEQKIIFIFI
jgi:hypothetical protein